MASQKLGLASLAVLLLALTQAAIGEVPNEVPSGTPRRPPNDAIIPEKRREAFRILANPPPAFQRLMDAVPFSIYGKDKHNNYVAICNTKAMDWGVLSTTDSEELREYIQYVSLFFWHYVDKRADSSLTLVLDADGFSFNKVLNGSVAMILKAIVGALSETMPFVREREGKIFLINTPSFLTPLIKAIPMFSNHKVELLALSHPDEWMPVLREHIGPAFLPIEYGGRNSTKVENSAVVKYIRNSVAKIMKMKTDLESNL